MRHATWVPINGSLETSYNQNFRYSSTTSFTFDRASDELYFVNDGGLVYAPRGYTLGTISFTNDAGVDIDNVEVQVTTFYNSLTLFGNTTICTLDRPENKHGLGIFVSDDTEDSGKEF